MSENKVLVKLDVDWADEFTVQALWATTQGEYDTLIKVLSEQDIQGQDIYYGTNEYFNFDSLEDLLSALTVQEISEAFYVEFINTIGTSFGMIDISELPNWFE